jgi:hypothetical protein
MNMQTFENYEATEFEKKYKQSSDPEWTADVDAFLEFCSTAVETHFSFGELLAEYHHFADGSRFSKREHTAYAPEPPLTEEQRAKRFAELRAAVQRDREREGGQQ